MKEIGAFEAKTRLGQLLDAVEAGEEILITRRGNGSRSPRPFRWRSATSGSMRSIATLRRPDAHYHRSGH